MMVEMDAKTKLRKPKTLEQIAAIEGVQRATEAAMAAVIEYIRSNSAPTSEEAHKIIDELLERAECESPQGAIVAGGIQSAAPHEKGSGLLLQGEGIVIDIFPRSKKTGYFADMSRTVCLGEPSSELQKMYDAVLGAQELAIAMVRPGVKGSDIQKAVEAYFIQKGFLTTGKGEGTHGFAYAEGFVHSVGHGVGLEIHEAPKIAIGEDVLMVGDVITIEPGLYYKAIGGVRLEDMLLITETGFRNLTNFEKELAL